MPLEPVSNAVAFQNRVALRMNRAGSDFQNPIIGTQRYVGIVPVTTYGINTRIRFNLANASETVRSAVVRSYDSSDVLQATTSIRSSFSLNTTTLVAQANLVPGLDLPTTADGYRNEVTVTTSSGRVMKQQLFVRDMPDNAVVFNGQVTTETTPLDIEMDSITANGATSASWAVSFFPTWNDEVGRQHGASTVGLTENIIKPYGGAATVEVYRESAGNPWANLVYSERPVEELTTMTHAPVGDGEQQEFNFRFRSLAGSTEYVRATAYVRFYECDSTTVTTVPTLADTYPDQAPIIVYPPSNPRTNGPPPFNESGMEVTVRVQDLGSPFESVTDYSDATITIEAYDGGIADVGGSDPANPIVVYLGSQTETVATGDVGTDVTFSLETALQDATMLIVSIQGGLSSDGVQGNALVFITADSDEGSIPDPPSVSGVSFNFSSGVASFTVNSFGWQGEDITVHCQPMYGVIQNVAGQAQSDQDIGIETGSTELTDTILNSEGTGANTSSFTFSPTGPEAVAIWFTNSFGASTVFSFFDEGLTDAQEIKTVPSITTGSLTSGIATNDTVNFTLASDGGNSGNLFYHYIIIDSAQDTVTVNAGTATISPGTGSRGFTVDSGHDDIDGYYIVTVRGEQGGRSAPVVIANLSGARTLSS